MADWTDRRDAAMLFTKRISFGWKSISHHNSFCTIECCHRNQTTFRIARSLPACARRSFHSWEVQYFISSSHSLSLSHPLSQPLSQSLPPPSLLLSSSSKTKLSISRLLRLCRFPSKFYKVNQATVDGWWRYTSKAMSTHLYIGTNSIVCGISFFTPFPRKFSA